VINSNHTSLDSTAPFTRVITTDTPDEDPVQYVRQQYVETLGNDPDTAGHFYWTDKIIRCEADAACVNQTNAALTAFLSAAPPPTFSIDGQVIDENGAPISGVTVSLAGSQIVTMNSDSNGNFAFTNLATAGEYVVAGSKPHYSFQIQELITPTADEAMSLSGTLSQHDISGRVFANTGRALAGTTITLSGDAVQTATSDVNGDYTFPGLSAGGNYLVTVSRDNYVF